MIKKLKNIILYGLIILTSIFLGFFLEPKIRKVRVYEVVDYVMDTFGVTHTLNYDSEANCFYLYEISKKGEVKNKVPLQSKSSEKDKADHKFSYNNLEVDHKGDIYFVQIETKPIADGNQDKDELVKEQIFRYNTHCELITSLLEIYFTNEATAPTEPSIVKLQVVNERVTAFCKRGYTYEVLSLDRDGKEEKRISKIFSLPLPEGSITEKPWAVELLANSNFTNIVYLDSQGNFFTTDESTGNFKNLSEKFGDNIRPVKFSIDNENNIYFSDLVSGSFYEYSLETEVLQKLYGSEDIISKGKKSTDDIKLKDVTYITAIDSGDFCAIKKDANFKNYVRFGKDSMVISDIDNIEFERIIELLIIILLVFLILFGAVFFIKKLYEKRSVLQKALTLFYPAYILALGSVIIIVFNVLSSNQASLRVSEQESDLKILASCIKGDDLAEIDMLKDCLSKNYLELEDKINSGFKSVKKNDRELIVYTIRQEKNSEKIYRAFDNTSVINYELKRGNIFQSLIKLPTLPLEYRTSDALSKNYYNLYEKMLASPEKFQELDYVDNKGEWHGVFLPIVDSKNSLVGFLEGRIDRSFRSNYGAGTAFPILACSFIISGILLGIYLFIILFNFLKPIKPIGRYIELLCGGQWNKKLKIKTKDEFSGIAQRLNDASERAYQQISNLILMNEEYVKYSPKGIFLLFDKNDITEIKPTDTNEKYLYLLRMTFFDTNYKSFRELKEDYFYLIQKSFPDIYKAVEDNQGIIENFDGIKMTAVFPYSAENAIKASVRLKEVFSYKNMDSGIKIILSAGNTRIGIIGNEERSNITISSDQILIMSNLEPKLEKIQLKHIALEKIILDFHESDIYNYRLIGQIRHIKNDSPVKIYEFIDNKDSYEKNLYILTKQKFQNGVEKYISGNFTEAKTIFSSVLSANRDDAMAMYYITLCDSLEKITIKNWKGFILE